MSKTFFTADTHFGHARIIDLCSRPFETVEDMDEEMIARWNKVVGPDDFVWHLGDFTMKGAEEALAYRQRLNGRIALIWGNHDRQSVRSLPASCWEHLAGSRFATEVKVEGWDLTLCHYAMRAWNGSFHKTGKSLMLYGHSHGMLPPIHHSLDVGVDCWNFYPVSLDQILDYLQCMELL